MRTLAYIFALALISAMSTQCRKDSLTTDPSAKLSFSKDTVLFDTVFTTVGSTTQQLKVYNRNANAVKISRAYLAGGASSPFRLNFDGVPGLEFSDVVLEGGDSLFMFVEVTLEVNNLTNPLVIEDSIIFESNGNISSVRLVVWGQDAYFHVNELVDGTWMNDKPHVVYGIAAVGFPQQDSGTTLTIPAGTHVHFHANSLLYVYKSTLQVNGTEGNEVIFEGDRLETFYEDRPGQWDGIWLIHSEQSTITHAIIKNGTRGIWAYKTNPTTGNTALTLNNTKVYDQSFSGIWCDESKVVATNNLFADNGSYSGVFVNGGEYAFNHCTFANFWSWGDRTTPCFLLNNYYEDEFGANVTFDYTSTIFENCIFDGTQLHEFAIDTVAGATTDFQFHNSIVTSDETVTSNSSYYTTIYQNSNPGFIDENERDFRLASNAFAIDKGNGNNPLIDVDDNPRDAFGDLGCFERQ